MGRRVKMDAAEVVALLRRIRHDYGNHLQVISGYNELGRPDEVREYIAEIIQEITQEKRILELDDSELGLFLFKQMLLANDLGIILRYKEISIVSGQRLIDNFEPYKTIENIVKENILFQNTVMEVSIYEENDQIKVEIECPMLPNKHFIFYIKE
ncbi:MAG: hypothetical protein GX790_00235 [Syntrophomonadaceae bacterium]|nr:hypothetical protein [Syntrophomonadaceae bacterium]